MRKNLKIIELIREMMVGNAPGSGGGFGSKSPDQGPTAGFDPLLKFKNKNKDTVDFRRVPKSYKNWVKSLNKRT